MTSNPLSFESIAECFASPGEREQRQLIERIFGEMPDAEAQLLSLFEIDKRVSVRRWLVEALCRFDSSAANDAVQCALSDAAMSMRLHALSGIRANRRIEFLRWVIPLTEDVSGAIRLRALKCLVEWRYGGAPKLLQRALIDEKAYLRAFAIKALATRRRP